MGGIGTTSQQILFFKAKGDESDRPLETHVYNLTRDIQKNGQRTGIVVRPRRANDSIVMRRKNERSRRRIPVMRSRRYHILVDPTPSGKLMRDRRETKTRELLSEIVSRASQRLRG